MLRTPPWTRTLADRHIPLSVRDNTNSKHAHIHRTHDPRVQTVEDSASFGLLNVTRPQQ